MKFFLAISLLLVSPNIYAHGPHPLVENYSKSIVDGYDHALHHVGYSESDFDDLIGVSSVQDAVRKVRVIRYRFVAAQCAKDLEVYFKLDGSSYLSHKVVGCVP